jgi:hypothetical protein
MVMNYKKWLDSEYIPKLKPIAFWSFGNRTYKKVIIMDS